MMENPPCWEGSHEKGTVTFAEPGQMLCKICLRNREERRAEKKAQQEMMREDFTLFRSWAKSKKDYKFTQKQLHKKGNK